MMFKKRWVIFKEPFIIYYEGTKDVKPKGITILSDFDLGKKSKKLFRVSVKGRTFEYKADSEEERDEWIKILEKPLNFQTNYQLPQFNERDVQVLQDKGRASTATGLEGFGREFIKSVHSPLYIGKAIQQKIKSTLLSVSLEGAVKHGHLYKMGSDLGLNLIPNPITQPRWAKRFLILKDQTIYFLEPHKTLPDPNTELTPSSYLSLNHTTKIVYAPEKTGKDFAFEVYSKNSCAQLSATSRDEMNQWAISILEESGNSKDADIWMLKHGEKKRRESTAAPTAADLTQSSRSNNRKSLPVSLSSSYKEESSVPLATTQDKYKIHEANSRWGLSPATFNEPSPSSSPRSYSISGGSQDYGKQRPKKVVPAITHKSAFSFPSDEESDEDAPLVDPKRRSVDKPEKSSCCVIL
eukprot:TRINITY_DN3790_c2_g1_i2.p1 TRINITY_DN3790_c2_g1~~TRINITY_DN3790_c2_g1_i2.p1  ORF type:complete len:410 (+),score=129.51 TRINITY_DN3790_c2_g1_i2:138-1367(+)